MWARLLEELSVRDQTVATAESLTGGMLASEITDVPGASRVFRGGVVAYATDVKTSVLQVPGHVVDQHGVVSEACARAMATGVRELLQADFGLATTGVAGPDSQEGHPVGTVWVAVAGPDQLRARLLSVPGSRAEVRADTCSAVARLLADILHVEETALR